VFWLPEIQLKLELIKAEIQDFIVIQILREINCCRESTGSKTAILFAILQSLKFVDLQEFIKLKVQSLSICFK